MGKQAPEQTPALKQSRPGRGRLFWLKAAVGSGLFTGFSPLAPATVTSLFTLVPVWYLHHWPVGHAAAVVLVFSVGVPIATVLEKHWGPDPGRVTIDEIAGTLLTFLLLPGLTVWSLFIGFAFWRFFDIVKLPFIDRSQRLPGGWGIMTDDILAGICANLVMQALLRIGPRLIPALDSILLA